MTVEAALLVAVATVAGWGERPSLVVAGADASRGVLVNVTPGARPSDGPDPSRPTVVFVHGFNPCPRTVHFHMVEEFARSLARRGGPPLNVFGWDWNAATFTSVPNEGQRRGGRRTGAHSRRDAQSGGDRCLTDPVDRPQRGGDRRHLGRALVGVPNTASRSRS